jgi:opacity protein-like surface antigen
MKTKILTTIASGIFLAATPAMAGTVAISPDEPTLVTTTESGWRVSSSVYGWFTRLDGEMAFNGTTVPVDVPFDEIFDNLKFSFMGLVEVGKGRWSFMGDFFYAKLEPSVTNQLGTFDSQIEQFVGNYAVFYRVAETPTGHLDVYGETDVDIHLNNNTNFSASGEKTWIDPLVGIRFRRDLSEKVFLLGLADIGGFGVSSDLTWQAMLTLGYRVSDRMSLGLGYRAIGTDYTSGPTTYDVVSHGLLLGSQFKF